MPVRVSARADGAAIAGSKPIDNDFKIRTRGNLGMVEVKVVGVAKAVLVLERKAVLPSTTITCTACANLLFST